MKEYDTLQSILAKLPTHNGILTKIYYVSGLFRDLVKDFHIDNFSSNLQSINLTKLNGPVWYLGEEYHNKGLPTMTEFLGSSKLPLPYWIKKLQYTILSNMYHDSSFGWSTELFWAKHKSSSVGEHLDNDDVYTIQIYGTKEWIVDSPDLERLINFVKNGRISRTNSYDAWISNSEKKIEFLNPQIIIMNPGDFLAIPAYSLHEVITQSNGRNLSVNASICQEQIYDSLMR